MPSGNSNLQFLFQRIKESKNFMDFWWSSNRFCSLHSTLLYVFTGTKLNQLQEVFIDLNNRVANINHTQQRLFSLPGKIIDDKSSTIRRGNSEGVWVKHWDILYIPSFTLNLSMSGLSIIKDCMERAYEIRFNKTTAAVKGKERLRASVGQMFSK